MKKTMKTILLSLSVLGFITLQSCLNNNDIPSRTPETEQKEIKEAIQQLTSKGYNVDTTNLGVYYIMTKFAPDSLPLPQAGDTCSMIYTGFFLDGIIFDASYYHYADSTWEFKYLETNLIAGFNDGIALLRKGAAAEIIVPSNLAYGATGTNSIPPYTPLVFSLKMRNLMPKAQ